MKRASYFSAKRPEPRVKTPRYTPIDLGLAISGATMKPGTTRTRIEIAAFCSCSPESIRLIEAAALAKLRIRILRAIPLDDLPTSFREGDPFPQTFAQQLAKKRARKPPTNRNAPPLQDNCPICALPNSLTQQPDA